MERKRNKTYEIERNNVAGHSCTLYEEGGGHGLVEKRERRRKERRKKGKRTEAKYEVRDVQLCKCCASMLANGQTRYSRETST